VGDGDLEQVELGGEDLQVGGAVAEDEGAGVGAVGERFLQLP
jgi:hypothetical protein